MGIKNNFKTSFKCFNLGKIQNNFIIYPILQIQTQRHTTTMYLQYMNKYNILLQILSRIMLALPSLKTNMWELKLIPCLSSINIFITSRDTHYALC